PWSTRGVRQNRATRRAVSYRCLKLSQRRDTVTGTYPPRAMPGTSPPNRGAVTAPVRQGDADVSTEDRTRARRADETSGRGGEREQRRREPAPPGRKPAARSGPAQLRPVSSVASGPTE